MSAAVEYAVTEAVEVTEAVSVAFDDLDLVIGAFRKAVG